MHRASVFLVMFIYLDASDMGLFSLEIHISTQLYLCILLCMCYALI